MIKLILIALTVASWVYWLLAWWWVRTFFKSGPIEAIDYTPPVTILKPVKGLDPQAYENFASFCRQDYPDFELIFGVADKDDPVIPVIEQLQRDFPERQIRLIIAPATRVNRKASLLQAVSAHVRHEVLVVSDSDMRVRPDYLRRVVAPLADKSVGLVTCPYQGRYPVTLTARLEALHMGVTFLPSVLVARRFLSMRFAMGATVALRRSDLARIGGFNAVADYLADDYQLGVLISNLGLRVKMSDYIVDSIIGPTTFVEQWNREVRWAHCNRVSRPVEYPGLILTFSTPLALLLMLVTSFSALSLVALGISLLLRWAVGFLVLGITDNKPLRRWLIWLPLRDMLSAFVWGAGTIGRRVVWRGEEFVLASDGRLEPVHAVAWGFSESKLPLVVEWLVRILDAVLRRVYHIFEFDPRPQAMLRLSLGKAGRDLDLSDGTRIARGDPIGELHFWNEHLPPMPEGGPDLGWARAFHRGVTGSLSKLTVYIENDERFKDVQAFRGNAFFGGGYEWNHGIKLAARWGFDLVACEPRTGLGQRLMGFLESGYALALVRVFTPASMKDISVGGVRNIEIWMPRSVLMAKYGARKQLRDGVEEIDSKPSVNHANAGGTHRQTV
jgi:ceramide glucosyltransferase